MAAIRKEGPREVYPYEASVSFEEVDTSEIVRAFVAEDDFIAEFHAPPKTYGYESHARMPPRGREKKVVILRALSNINT